MQKDTVVFIVAIACITILGIVIALVPISPDRLTVLRAIIDALAVVLGVSGRTVVPRLAVKIKDKLAEWIE